MTRSLRIATIVDLAPRKVGSMEDSLVSLVEGAAARGHRMDIFTYAPVQRLTYDRLTGKNLSPAAEVTKGPCQ